MIKFFKYLVQSMSIYIFYIFGRILGIKLSRKIFAFIFSRFAPFFKSKKVIEKNLSIFNEKILESEKKRISLNMWKNYGMTFIEYIFLDFFRKNNSHIQIVGEKNLDNIINKNKPAIFVSGHFANFELMSMEITKKNIKLATIYRPLNNFFLNPFMEYIRKKYVCENQIKKGLKGVRESIEYLKKDISIALMIDQRVSEGEKIPFFGKLAFTTTLPAQLAIKFNVPIIPVFIERIDQDKFRIEFLKEIYASNIDNKINLTKKLNKVLENMILKNPNHWIWTHNRWK